jgi:hypothetical protein
MAYNPFGQANQSLFRTLHHRWRQQRSSVQILRSQVGFTEEHPPTQPLPCRGCINYHGIAYGSTREARSRLICAIHPQGWLTSSICPDWQGDMQVHISA